MIDRKTSRQTDKQTDRQADRQTDKQTDRQKDKQTDRQTGKKTDRLTYVQREREKNKKTFVSDLSINLLYSKIPVRACIVLVEEYLETNC